MRVLISAYACEPNKGSEPEAGWEWAMAAAKVASSVTVLTRSNNRNAIERTEIQGTNLSFEFFDLPPWACNLKNHIPYGTQLYYLAWQLAARRVVAELHRGDRFDLTHHLTFAVDWLPVACAIPGVPLVWGPVGGATGLPWRLWRSQGPRGVIRELGRELFSRSLRRAYGNPIAQAASVAIAQNYDQERLLRGVARFVVVEPNVVIDPSLGEAEHVPEWFGSQAFREAVFVGRLIPHKGLVYAIRALASPLAATWRLTVVGDGPERKRCERLAHDLGVAERVHFVGRIPRANVAALLRRADVMLAPSMYEGSGFAVAEAVTLGCPVIATKRGGPEVMVSKGAGALVEADGHLAEHLASALAAVGGRNKADDRWTATRIPSFLTDVYRIARADVDDH